MVEIKKNLVFVTSHWLTMENIEIQHGLKSIKPFEYTISYHKLNEATPVFHKTSTASRTEINFNT